MENKLISSDKGVKNYSNRFIIDILRYSPSKIIPLLVSFLWSYIFTRLFSPEEYGIYGLVISITGPLVIIVVEWAAQPLGRFFSDYYTNGKMNVYNSLVNYYKKIILIITFGIILSSFIVGYFFYNNYLFLLLPASLSVIINSLSALYLPILPASLDPNSYRKIQIYKQLLRLFIAILLVFGIEENVSFLLWADVIASLIFLFPLINIAKSKINISKNSQVENKDFIFAQKQFLFYGFPMMLWFLGSQMLFVGDRFIIQLFLGEKEVGIYTANYMLISGFSGLLSAPINLAAFPLIMKIWSKRNEEKIVKVIKNMTYFYSVISIGVIFGTALIDESIVKLSLGSEFHEGINIIVPTILGLVIWQGSILGHKGIELKEKTKFMVLFILLAATINIILNLLFVPIYGYIASAWTTFISYLIYAFLIWLFSKKYIPWKIEIFKLIPFIILASVLTYGLSLIKVENLLISFSVKSILFTLFYISISVVIYKKHRKEVE